MSIELIEPLKKYNYWQNEPQQLGLIRRDYLDRIESYDQANSMIVVTGARRAGKSTIVKQYVSRLLQQGIPAGNILYFNFYIRQLQQFCNESLFFKVVEVWHEQLCSRGPSYLIIDEVQELENWDHVVASLFEDHTLPVKLILTGSNSKLLASEVTTKLSGRYFSIEVFPFSYQEYCEFRQLTVSSVESFESFVKHASTPEVAMLDDEEAKANLMEGIIYSTIQKDIIERFNPTNPAILSRLVNYIRLNSSNEFSLKKVVDRINHQSPKKESVGKSTIDQFLSYLSQVYFSHQCPIYSYRKKDILDRSSQKIYLNDHGMALFLNGFEKGRVLENVIFMELIKKGYAVYTYLAFSSQNYEIDFFASKGARKLFVQVAWMLGDSVENRATHEREFGNLRKVKESGEKWLVTMDEVAPEEGVLTAQPQDFLVSL